MKILRIVAVDVVRESQKFSGHPYVGRIARLSSRQHSFLVHVWTIRHACIMTLLIAYRHSSLHFLDPGMAPSPSNVVLLLVVGVFVVIRFSMY